ncbi:MAG TPA: DNA sulfur modification protein DndE [Syntrophaceae bacterium]|jgi:DNA sulfur modification protein DndE|nr:DNA sulfur modification protein DndE [Syntrophaceae bacterium]
MKPPVGHVRVSAKGKDILIKIKRNTGLEHWNEICRIALCYSLANPTKPPFINKNGDSSIDMDWKIFAGRFQDELTALIALRAMKDGIHVKDNDTFIEYFRAHIERGISSISSINLSNICNNGIKS